MKVNEIRIGNWVQLSNGTQLKIDGIISVNNTSGYNLSTLKPIPLTEEWLLRFGFNQCENPNWFEIRTKNMVLYCNLNGRADIETTNDSHIVISLELKYVHQLQNLYWCLCGEELMLH